MSMFETAYNFVREWEGGWSNHAADPGGLTRWGITLKTLLGLNEDLNNDGKIDGKDLRDMTKEQAKALYKEHYWFAAHCDELPDPIAIVVFDCAVNQGVARAVRWMQAAGGAKVDGVFGPETLGKVLAAEPQKFINEFCVRRALHYAGLGIFKHFGTGWMRRLFAVHGVASKLC